MSKRPGEGGPPTGAKRPYGGPGQEFLDSEPMLPEEYEDPDDEDVFLNDVLDQKVAPARSHLSLLFLNRRATPPRGEHPRSIPDQPPILPRLLASLSFPQVIVADAEREHWKRKPAPAMDPAKDAIVFQQLDIDYVIAEPHPMLGPERKAMGAAAMLRIFGVTAGGNSVCVHVHGFEPYFYAKVPDSFQEGMCEGLRKNLNELMAQQQRGGRGGNSVFISAVSVVRDRESLMYYQEGKKSVFVKITTTLPNMVATARGILEKQGLLVPGLHHTALTFQTFESNVLYTLRFMVDRGVVGGNWVELPAGCYTHRAKKPRSASCPWTSSARDARDTSRTQNTIPSFRSPPWYVRVPVKRMTGRRLFSPGLATVSLPRSPPAEGENQTDVFLFLLSWNRR